MESLYIYFASLVTTLALAPVILSAITDARQTQINQALDVQADT